MALSRLATACRAKGSEDDRHRVMFLETLRDGCERSEWKICAWVLMSNHYPKVLQTLQPSRLAG